MRKDIEHEHIERIREQASVMLFAGKGGVGKTTNAAATALHYASMRKKTLAISTDATPSLSHIFEVESSTALQRIRESLFIHELGVEEVKEMWDRKFGREVFGVFSSFVSVSYEEFVAFMTSLLPGLSDEFMIDYIRELRTEGTYDAIIWDTAPLGQTLALLLTPAMLGEHLRMAPRIYSKLKQGQMSKEPILDIIKRWEKLSADNVHFLQNEVNFTMVTIPEALAVEQLEGIFSELNTFGLTVGQLIVNNVITDTDSVFLSTKADQQKRYLDMLYERYSDIPIVTIPMFPYEIKGVDRIKQVEKVVF